jgi:uncharacterized protein
MICYRHRNGLFVPQERSAVKIESRADSEGKKKIKGYAAVYYDASVAGSEYWLWDDMVERLMPGCFDRAIREAHDARCLFNHSQDLLLGRVASGTLRLAVDGKGLIYECDEDPSDPHWQSVAAKIDRGDVTGSSFAFVATKTTWVEEKVGDKYLYIRNIQDVDLYDASPVTWPAYTAASVGRSAMNRLASDDPERRALETERDAYFRSLIDPAIIARAVQVQSEVM